MKRSFARSFHRKQRGVNLCAAALRNRVQADVDSGAGDVGGRGALIQSRTGIGVAQQRDRETANLQFVPQQAGKSQRDVFLGELIGQGRASFIATVCGIDDGQNATRIVTARAAACSRSGLAQDSAVRFQFQRHWVPLALVGPER